MSLQCILLNSFYKPRFIKKWYVPAAAGEEQINENIFAMAQKAYNFKWYDNATDTLKTILE